MTERQPLDWASPTRAVDSPEETCPLVWIAVELQYEDDHAPFASERYEMVLTDSKTQQDTLSGGRVYFDKIPPGTCSIRFIDWKSAGA